MAVHFALDSAQLTLVCVLDSLEPLDPLVPIMDKLLQEFDLFKLGLSCVLVSLQCHELGRVSVSACSLCLLKLRLKRSDLSLCLVELMLELGIIGWNAG